ncbi:MAG: hypothetical protein PHN98_07775 [Smithellaceae bacterium]|nr:hypothetical protein [Smithellaceae bacterium]
MSVIDLINKEDIREFFCKDWMMHDGIWFAQSAQEIGIEKTNQLNTNGIKMMSENEILRLIKLFNNGSKSFNSYEEFQKFLTSSIDFVRPDFMKFTFAFPRNKIFQIDFQKCWAFEGVKRLGFIEQYECAVVIRLKSWFDVLGIQYSMLPDFKKCLMNETGICSYQFQFLKGV